MFLQRGIARQLNLLLGADQELVLAAFHAIDSLH
jgi:hypothetical protein